MGGEGGGVVKMYTLLRSLPKKPYKKFIVIGYVEQNILFSESFSLQVYLTSCLFHLLTCLSNLNKNISAREFGV